MTKRDKLSQEEITQMIKRTGSGAVDEYTNRIKEIEIFLHKKQDTADKDKIDKFKIYLEYYREELDTLNFLTKQFNRVLSAPEDYPDINVYELQVTYLVYTQMICLENIGITLGREIDKDKLASVTQKIEENKQKLKDLLKIKDVEVTFLPTYKPNK